MARGRYTIVGKLAHGGMAEIFLAKQHGVEGFQKPVVLKRILSAFSADAQFRNMFIDEAHISMTLSHGNIVQVLDAGMSGERMFLALELVEGWDLEAVIARAHAAGPDHPWPPSLALLVGAQICRGLSYAHAKRGPDGRALGIVHRDVSPTNILLSDQGEVKLTDFGIAKAERKREQTAAGVIKGKIGFMSPEQARGQPLDARADLFSLGAVMYLMLTGRKPFEASSDLESLMRAQKAEYVPPETLNGYLSPETTAIVNRAMRREVSARYQTADEMLVDLEKVLRTQYHSAGQTELKLWLAELARRDGQQPLGHRSAPGDDARAMSGGIRGDSERGSLRGGVGDGDGIDIRSGSGSGSGSDAPPMFVDSASDLSAGSLLELADIDLPGHEHEARTRVSLTPGPVARVDLFRDAVDSPTHAQTARADAEVHAAPESARAVPGQSTPTRRGDERRREESPRMLGGRGAESGGIGEDVGGGGGPASPDTSSSVATASDQPGLGARRAETPPPAPVVGLFTPDGFLATGAMAGPLPSAPSGPMGASPSLPASSSSSSSSSASPLSSTRRYSRRSRAGLGFIAGAICMLGAVYAIRWLAEWAGKDIQGTRTDAGTAQTEVTSDVSVVGRDANLLPESNDSNVIAAAEPVNGGGPAPSLAAPSSGSATETPTTPMVSSTPDAPEPAAPPTVAGVAAPTTLPRPADGGLSADGGRPERTGAGGAAVVDDTETEDEAKLLNMAISNRATAVIGEDDAEASDGARTESDTGGGARSKPSATAAATAAAASAAAEPAPSGAKSKESSPSLRQSKPRDKAPLARVANARTAPAKPVSVRITSSPLGAVVRTKKQVLGRTPLSIRFHPGNTYQLTFVKSGYVTAHRPLAVTTGKPSQLSVAMKKASPPAARRIFFLGR